MLGFLLPNLRQLFKYCWCCYICELNVGLRLQHVCELQICDLPKLLQYVYILLKLTLKILKRSPQVLLFSSMSYRINSICLFISSLFFKNAYCYSFFSCLSFSCCNFSCCTNRFSFALSSKIFLSISAFCSSLSPSSFSFLSYTIMSLLYFSINSFLLLSISLLSSISFLFFACSSVSYGLL